MTRAASPAPFVDNADLLPRVSKKSDDYVAEILRAQAKLKQARGTTVVSTREKQRRLAAILSDKENYMKRLGQGMREHGFALA